MGCFIVTTAEAVAVKAIEKSYAKKNKLSLEYCDDSHISFVTKLGWLSKMLMGGSALLAFEHIWHGEITATFPFLTALADYEGTSELIHEMATRGGTMALTITAIWIFMVGVSYAMEKNVKKCKATI